LLKMRFKIYFQKNFEQSYRKKMKKTTQIGNLVQFFKFFLWKNK